LLLPCHVSKDTKKILVDPGSQEYSFSDKFELQWIVPKKTN